MRYNKDSNLIFLQKQLLGEKVMERFKSMPIEKLNISVRTYNCLKRRGISTVGEVAEMSNEEMKRIRNLGIEGYNEIIEKLEEAKKSMSSETQKELP